MDGYEFIDYILYEENLNNTINGSCERWHDFPNANLFFECYALFFKRNIAKSTIELALILLIFLLNLIVIIRICKNSVFNIYDQILISQIGTNIARALLEMPFFHIENKFGYWGFGPKSSMTYAAFNSCANTVVTLQVLYMSYVRFRSIKSPALHKSEILIKKPIIMISLFWIFGVSVWFSTTFNFKTYRYTTHINYNPHSMQTVLNFLSWTLPLFMVFVISLYIIFRLGKKNKINIKMTSKAKKNSFKNKLFGTKSKFTIIVVCYLVQWSAPSIFILIEPYLEEQAEILILTFKWSTYTVCLTDALAILFFDSNQSVLLKRSLTRTTNTT